LELRILGFEEINELYEHLDPEFYNNFEKTDEMFWIAPYFKEVYPNNDEFEFAIRHCDMKSFLNSFLKKCHEFSDKFYIDFKSTGPKIRTISDDSD